MGFGYDQLLELPGTTLQLERQQNTTKTYAKPPSETYKQQMQNHFGKSPESLINFVVKKS